MKENKKPLLLPWAILAGIMAVLLIALCVATPIAYQYSDQINAFFNCQTYELVNVGDEEVYDAEYYTSDFVQKDAEGNPVYVVDEETGYRHQVYDDNALRVHNYALAEEAAAEGITLMWNHNNALPLAEGSNVSCFSRSSVDPLYGGGGSGVANPGSADFLTGLREAGFNCNNTLADFYRGQPARRTAEGNPQDPDPFLMNETPWSRVIQNTESSFAEYGDAAIVMISRYSAEHWGDMFMSGSDTESGEQLDFTPEELDMIEGLVARKGSGEGQFEKIILVLNTCNTVNLGMIKDQIPDIDACLWIGYPGNRGLISLGKILDGEYNPSGRLVDTFTYDTAAVPGAATYGDNRYSNWQDFDIKIESAEGANYSRPFTYMTYNEGIYVGYRYFETRYEDAVYNRYGALSDAGTAESVSGWNYEEEVAFSFGSGESYTEFTYDNFSVSKDGEEYTLSVDVSNAANGRPGKAVAQFYLQKPYTAYDREKGVEKSAVELVGFGKTGEIAPGDSETVTVTVDEEQLKSYDANGYGTYIIEQGEYYFAFGEDSHDAMNNILAAKGFTEADGMDAPGNSAFAKPVTIGGETDILKYSVSTATGEEITNRFDHADWNKSGLGGGEEIVYMTRSNWSGTYPTPKQLTMNADLAEALDYDRPVKEDPEAKMPEYGKSNGMSLIMLRDLPYNDPAWGDLLDQMTFDEQANMLASSFRTTQAVQSINKPATRENDGPMGIRSAHSNGMWSTTFPCAPIIAATFNTDLIRRVGDGKGEDILHSGHNGLYGTGANIHRVPQSGRNFEYYSEDPYLSGIAVANETLGIQSNGVYCILKHYAMNDQELNRWGVNTWVQEQAIREIYLLPFEYSVVIGDAHGMMSGFNRVGAVWAGADAGLCTDVLRGEWGFDGFVISDCQVNQYMSYVDGVLGGNDLWLYSILGEGFHRWENSPTVAQAMRESTHRVLYTVLHSNAMNGVTSNIEIHKIVTWWQHLITVLIVVLAVLTAVFVGLTAQSVVRRILRSRKREN